MWVLVIYFCAYNIAIQAAGNTVVLVTHEEDIAQHAKRVIRLVDGNIDSDISK